jgi:phosphatidylinositol alpha-1,6-mannosyltransferase
VKILVVANYFPEHVGGIGSVAGMLVAGYRAAGHEVAFAAARVEPHSGPAGDLPLTAWNVAEDRFGFPYPLPGPVSAARLAALARAADVVHVHDCLYAASALAFSAARLARRPVLLTQHVAAIPYSSGLLRALQAGAYASLGRLLLSGADQVVFVSERVRRLFARVRFKRAPLLIENGVDMALFHPATPSERRRIRQRLGAPLDRPLLLFAGRFVEKKGVGLLQMVAAAEPEWEWLFVGGSGTIDPSGWRLPNVRVLEQVPQGELRDLYAAADLLVLPSVGEGFPLVVQEAMACGTPALVSPESASGITVGRELLLQAEPAADAVLASLRRLLPKLTGQSRSRVAAFACSRWSAERAASEYLEVLAEIAGAH